MSYEPQGIFTEGGSFDFRQEAGSEPGEHGKSTGRTRRVISLRPRKKRIGTIKARRDSRLASAAESKRIKAEVLHEHYLSLGYADAADFKQKKKEAAKERRKQYEAKRSKTPEYKEKARAYSAKYHAKPESRERVKKNESKTEVAKKRNARRRNQRANDPLHGLVCRMRGGTYRAFANNGFKKESKTAELLGCSWEFLRSHIESKFTKGMSWGNRDQWHIDHVVPLASGATESEVVALCHFSNLRPMWAKDNKAKGDRVVTCQPELLLKM